MSETNIFVELINAFDPIIDTLLDILIFPLDAVVGFIWGGIRELITDVLF